MTQCDCCIIRAIFSSYCGQLARQMSVERACYSKCSADDYLMLSAGRRRTHRQDRSPNNMILRRVTGFLLYRLLDYIFQRVNQFNITCNNFMRFVLCHGNYCRPTTSQICPESNERSPRTLAANLYPLELSAVLISALYRLFLDAVLSAKP